MTEPSHFNLKRLGIALLVTLYEATPGQWSSLRPAPYRKGSH